MTLQAIPPKIQNHWRISHIKHSNIVPHNIENKSNKPDALRLAISQYNLVDPDNNPSYCKKINKPHAITTNILISEENCPAHNYHRGNTIALQNPPLKGTTHEKPEILTILSLLLWRAFAKFQQFSGLICSVRV